MHIIMYVCNNALAYMAEIAYLGKLQHYVYVVVQFYPWFNFYFPLFQTHYHILPCPKTKENKN